MLIVYISPSPTQLTYLAKQEGLSFDSMNTGLCMISASMSLLPCLVYISMIHKWNITGISIIITGTESPLYPFRPAKYSLCLTKKMTV